MKSVINVKRFLHALEWKIKRLRVTLNSQVYWSLWDATYHTKLAKQRIKRRLHYLKKTRTSKPYLPVNEKTFDSCVRHDCESSQHWSVRERSDFWTSPEEERSPSP